MHTTNSLHAPFSTCIFATPRRITPHSAKHHPPTATTDPTIHLIISDVDGTLLDSQQNLSPVNITAITAAYEQAGVPTILATGKAIGPWTSPVLERLPKMPQIFLQGLLIRNAEGEVIYSRTLDEDLIHDAVDFADKTGIQLIAYLGDRIVCKETDHHTDRLYFYNEPPPEGIGSLKDHTSSLPMMKLIFMADQPILDTLRPQIEQLFDNRATITTAIVGMLEVLPLGASKGTALAWLLPQLGIDFENCMAMGDGENDVEMLKLVGLGVVVGNAHPPAREAADVVVGSNDDDGVAEAIERFVLQPRGLSSVDASV